MKFLSVEILGYKFKTGGEHHFNELIFRHLAEHSNSQLFLAHHNLHSLALGKKNAEFKQYFQTVDYIWLDGRPLVWMLKSLGYKVSSAWRLTFLDWQESFWNTCNIHKTRVFLLGGQLTVVDRFIDKVAKENQDIHFDGHHGYFTDVQNEEIVKKINSFKADILLVGMGMPNQELWIKKNQRDILARVIMPVGGYFDYIVGDTYTPPRWSGKLGLEWLFRLAASPRKLAHRYLVSPWSVLLSFIHELLNRRK